MTLFLLTERYRPSPIMVNYSLVQCLTGFPDGTEVKNLPANAGDARDSDLIPGSGRSPGGRNGSPLQYSCLRNPMDRGAWQAIVPGVPRDGHDLATEHSSTLPHGYTTSFPEFI